MAKNPPKASALRAVTQRPRCRVVVALSERLEPLIERRVQPPEDLAGAGAGRGVCRACVVLPVRHDGVDDGQRNRLAPVTRRVNKK